MVISRKIRRQQIAGHRRLIKLEKRLVKLDEKENKIKKAEDLIKNGFQSSLSNPQTMKNLISTLKRQRKKLNTNPQFHESLGLINQAIAKKTSVFAELLDEARRSNGCAYHTPWFTRALAFTLMNN